MGEPVKQLQQTVDDNQIFPDTLKRTVKNYQKAKYGYKLDDHDERYIEYNTLREQRQDTEEIKVIKVQRLFDRDNEKEHVIVYQNSRVKDHNNNYVQCPCTERLGVVPLPITNISNDARNKIQDISIVETQNEYTIPFSKNKLIDFFERSKDRHKIVCYVGYTKPTRIHKDDIIDNKKIIWNQERFINAKFNELVDKDEENLKVLDTKKAYVLSNKVRDINKGDPEQEAVPRSDIDDAKNKPRSQKVESLSELVGDFKLEGGKHSDNKKHKKEDQEQQQQQLKETSDIENETIKEYEELNK